MINFDGEKWRKLDKKSDQKITFFFSKYESNLFLFIQEIKICFFSIKSFCSFKTRAKFQWQKKINEQKLKTNTIQFFDCSWKQTVFSKVRSIIVILICAMERKSFVVIFFPTKLKTFFWVKMIKKMMWFSSILRRRWEFYTSEMSKLVRKMKRWTSWFERFSKISIFLTKIS